MPIYEYYCPDNNTIYQFYAKTLAQGQIIPRCPDNPAFQMRKLVSAFAVTRGGRKDDGAEPKGPAGADAGGDPAEDARMEAAMDAMEKEFSSVDENDPKAMARMMRRMSELTGEKIDGEMEEVVRKLEEGTDPDSLEEQLGGADEPGAGMDDPYGEGPAGDAAKPDPKEPKHRFKARRLPPRRDPKLYDYE
ncbi:FmdB family transcriptional regulator [Opitutus sp. ER46]|uniref:FmdB family transcriptional regulator n=1 Tax=Opitutus sp. ER46 TaxID=2161864 RepID=UPI000D317BD2|nr:FmdB family transcriptional regulator [Opitutus sp. ER46]PTX99035.1 FmdB family transcriptional regulator [Opitutus sp. ER46]